MSFNIGLNVVEVDGKAAAAIQPAATSIAGFSIKAVRGVPGEVVRITNRTQLRERFGEFRADAYGAYAVMGFLENGGSTAQVTRVVGKDAKAASATVGGGLDVHAGWRGKADPGDWGEQLSISIAAAGANFDVTVLRGTTVLETWTGLNATANSPRNAATVINDQFTGSKYIIVDVTGAVAAATTAVPLAGGEEGTFADADAEANAYAASIDLFELSNIQLLCCPESSAAAVVTKGLSHCELLGNRMFVGHTPQDQDASAAETYGKAFQGEKRYGALYFPWIRIADPLGGTKLVPPTGHVLGVYARTERERGIWKAPAGVGAGVRGALDVQFHMTDTDHTALVKNAGVNAVRFISGYGILVDSSRTLSTSTLWLYANVRLLFNFVESSLVQGLRWAVQEPNDPTLWNKVKFNTVTPFLMGLWRRGAFGPGSPEEVFTVKVDAENNPPDQIQQGLLTIEVYFYPSRPAETIVITVGQQEGGGSASES